MKHSSERVIRLRFDDRRPFGSPQHYFHFVWGYLLPALDRILQDAVRDAGHVYELQSCGPMMDPRSRELAGWLEPSLRIVDAMQPGEAATAGQLVPRWDWWLRGRTSLRIRWASRLHQLGLRHPVLRGIDRVRDFILARALAGPPPSPETARQGAEWLLLKRSDEPSFYRPDGPAEKPNYGLTRRSIANLEALAAELESRGRPVRIYEPGQDDLATQVRTYHAAAGVIGIRGAELANIVWMRPGSGVVMLVTPVKRENNVARHLAMVRGLRMQQIAVDSDRPIASADSVWQATVEAGR